MGLPHFIFSGHPTRPGLVEPMFAEQWAAFTQAGAGVSLCPEAVLTGGKALRGVPPSATVVYRGWMLKAGEYARLCEAVTAAGGQPLVTPAQYLLCHHLPNWYPLIAEFTPETRLYPATVDLRAELAALGWPAFFIKDYVKSLKTSAGSVVRDLGQVAEFVAEMERVRGEIEGGFCVRRVENFAPDSERRYFVIQGTAHAADGRDVPALVREVAARIRSPFFSVDVVQRRDGELRVVEVGDGQVSDLVGWSAEAFVNLWRGGETDPHPHPLP